jgi:hypothetical protein
MSDEAEKGDLVIVECISRAIGLTPGANSTYSIFRCGTVSHVNKNGTATRIKIGSKTYSIEKAPGYKAHHIVSNKNIDVKAALKALQSTGYDLDSLATIRDTIRPFLKGALAWQKNHKG